MQTLFITGGNGNIGCAIKSKFETNGYNVIAPSSKELDLSNVKNIQNYFKDNYIEPNVFVHCAGFNNPKPFEDISTEELQVSSSVNYLSFIELAKIFTPSMKLKKEGYILGISSLYGTITRKNRLAYTSSKHALNGVIQTLACELGEYNILVNSLAPGFVDTKMTRKNNSPEQISVMESKIPLKRLADVEDIANIAYFLCSNENKYITGQNIIADGGFMAECGQGDL